MSKQPQSKARVSRKVKRSKAKSSKAKHDLRAPFNQIVNHLPAVPAAYDIDLAHEVHQKTLTKGKKTGTLMYGRCPIAAVGYDATVANTLPFDSYYSGSSGFSHVIYMNPVEMFPGDSLEDRESHNYTRFKFNKLKVIYNGNAATSASTWFYAGYYPDGAISGGDINDTFMRANPGTMKVVSWNPKKCSDVSSLLPDDLYYNDADSGGGDSGYRQSYQGAIVGIWMSVPGSTSTTGELWIEYELELWDPRTQANLALSKAPRVVRVRGADKPRKNPEELKFRLHFPISPKNSEKQDDKQIAKSSPLPGPLRDPAPSNERKEELTTLVTEPDPIAGVVRVFRVENGKSILVEQQQMSRSARLIQLRRALSAAEGRSEEE